MDDALDPRAVGRGGPVRIGVVREFRGAGARGIPLDVPVLGPARRIGQPDRALEGGQEPVALGDPFPRARLEVEDVTQKILGRGVLVQPAHQVRDGAVEILGAHDGRVEQQAPGACLHRSRLMIGHTLEHLELDPGLDAPRLAQHEPVGDVEEVVAGDPQMHGVGVLRPAAVLEHALVVRVHLRFRLVGRLRPAVHRGLDALHGEVRALDDAQLDRRAAARPPDARPFGEGALGAVRIGQVGLEHDPRAQRQELRLVQDLAERGRREVEVPVFLHVEVDELRRDPSVRVPVPMAGGRPVERAEPLGHARDRPAKGDEVDLAEDRGDLDRDVLDVVAGEQREVGVQAARGFGLAQDRLAELVEIQAQPRAPSLGEIPAKILLFAGQDDVLRLVTQPVHDGRNDEARKVVRHGAAQEQRDALPPVHVLGHTVALEQVGELVGDALGPAAPEGLIGERDRQLLAVRVRHHPRELPGLRVLVRRLLRARLAQQRVGQLDGPMGEVPVHARAQCTRAPSRRRLSPCLARATCRA